MKPLLPIALILTLLASGCVQQDPSSPGDHTLSLQHDGLKRTYLVHIPPSYTKENPVPVILAFHGGGGNAEDTPRFYQLDEIADKEDFIVVYPEGTGRKLKGKVFGSWNAGRCCQPAQDENVDDVGFIEEMLDTLEENFNINKKRIYSIGHSNGALISYRLACELSDRIAAIAVAGAHDSFDNCSPSRPVPVLHFHGTQDNCALYEGGECGGCFADFLVSIGIPAERQGWTCSSVPEYIDDWKELNNCSNKKEVTYQNGSATCETYLDCKDDAEVTLCTIEGMGHTWPGRGFGNKLCEDSPDSDLCAKWKAVVGEPNLVDLNANNALWEFFEEHPMS
jgi:polyhydroxybutyrate depolymerase